MTSKGVFGFLNGLAGLCNRLKKGNWDSFERTWADLEEGWEVLTNWLGES